MKFIVSSSTLLKQLQTISGVLSSNNTLPILDNFLFEINKGILTVTASDVENVMTTEIKVESKDSGTIAVPAKLLLDTLKTFPEQPLTFTIEPSTFGIEISSDFGKYKLAGQSGDEFPKTTVLDNPSAITLEPSLLTDAITKTLFATGNDDLRPVMSGVFFQLSPENITFVATDAHKLVRYRRLDAQSNSNASFILPKKALNLLKNMIASSVVPVRVEFNNKNAHFASEYNNLICRLIDGKYPNYEAVIPKENPNRLTIDRQSLLSSIKRVSIFSNKSTHQVRLKISGSELNISAEDQDYYNEANERLTCAYTGEDMEIGFNSKFMLEMLNNLESENINIEMSSPSRAGILVPAENGEHTGEDILMLVMPVMSNN